MNPSLQKLLSDPSIQKAVGAWNLVRRDLSRRILLVDFSDELAIVAECKLRGQSFDLTQIDVTALPEGATDKGCPTEPEEMAALLKSVIAEKGLVAKRCATSLPAIAFTAVPLCIDAEISIEEALNELGESGSQVQLPFPRKQADIALIDNTSPHEKETKTHHSYMLVATQRSNTDRLLQTFEAAELDLQFIDCGLVVPLRLFAERIKDLGDDEEILHLNLSPGVTSCTVIWAGGAQKVIRMAPVRPYPAVKGEQEEADYFPISPDDLISLIRDIKRQLKQSSNTVVQITLGGTGSAHEGIDELIGDALGIKTTVINPLDDIFLGNVNLPPGVNAQVLSRIVGMAKRCLLAERLRSTSTGEGSNAPERKTPLLAAGSQETSIMKEAAERVKSLYPPLKALMRSNIGK